MVVVLFFLWNGSSIVVFEDIGTGTRLRTGGVEKREGSRGTASPAEGVGCGGAPTWI